MELEVSRHKSRHQACSYQQKLEDGISFLGRETPQYILEEVRKQFQARGIASTRDKLVAAYGANHADFILNRGIAVPILSNDRNSWGSIAQAFNGKRRPVSAPVARTSTDSRKATNSGTTGLASEIQNDTSGTRPQRVLPREDDLSLVKLHPRSDGIKSMVRVIRESSRRKAPCRVKKGMRRRAAAAAAAAAEAIASAPRERGVSESSSGVSGVHGLEIGEGRREYHGRPGAEAPVATSRPKSAGAVQCRRDKSSMAHRPAGYSRSTHAPSRRQVVRPSTAGVRPPRRGTSAAGRREMMGGTGTVQGSQTVDKPLRRREAAWTDDSRAGGSSVEGSNLGVIDLRQLTTPLSYARVSARPKTAHGESKFASEATTRKVLGGDVWAQKRSTACERCRPTEGAASSEIETTAEGLRAPDTACIRDAKARGDDSETAPKMRGCLDTPQERRLGQDAEGSLEKGPIKDEDMERNKQQDTGSGLQTASVSAVSDLDCLKGRYARATCRTRSAREPSSGRRRSPLQIPRKKSVQHHHGKMSHTSMRVDDGGDTPSALASRRHQSVEVHIRKTSPPAQAKQSAGSSEEGSPESQGWKDDRDQKRLGERVEGRLHPRKSSTRAAASVNRYPREARYPPKVPPNRRSTCASGVDIRQELAATRIQGVFRRCLTYRRWLGDKKDREIAKAFSLENGTALLEGSSCRGLPSGSDDKTLSFKAKAQRHRRHVACSRRLVRGFVACTQARLLALQLLWNRVEARIAGERRAKRIAMETRAAASFQEISHVRQIAAEVLKLQNSATSFVLKHRPKRKAGSSPARADRRKQSSLDTLEGDRQARCETGECDIVLREHGRRGHRLVDVAVRDKFLTRLLYSYRRQHAVRDHSEYIMYTSSPPEVNYQDVKRMLTCPAEEMDVFSDPRKYRTRARYTRFVLPYREIEAILQDTIAHELESEYHEKIMEALGNAQLSPPSCSAMEFPAGVPQNASTERETPGKSWDYLSRRSGTLKSLGRAEERLVPHYHSPAHRVVLDTRQESDTMRRISTSDIGPSSRIPSSCHMGQFCVRYFRCQKSRQWRYEAKP